MNLINPSGFGLASAGTVDFGLTYKCTRFYSFVLLCFRYADRNVYSDDDSDDMEAGYHEAEMEEKRSARIAREEDLAAEREEERRRKEKEARRRKEMR